MQCQYRWQLSPLYWRLRNRLQTARSWLSKRVFRWGHQRRSVRESLSAFQTLWRTILLQVVLAILLVSALELVEHCVLNVSFLGRIQLLNQVQLNPDRYMSLVTVLMEVTGAFLALYFTAMTVVASTVYADVADDVRQLIIGERFGNVYFRVVALLGVVAVILAASLTLGYIPGVLNLLLTALLATFSVFSFVTLGLRALQFFNPMPLIYYLDADLVKWIRYATLSGFRWQDPSFQTHYQRQAEKALRTYSSVTSLIGNRKNMGTEPLVEAVRHAFRLQRVYSQIKLQIPTHSNWYRRKGEFRDWLLTDHLRVKLALQTGTSLQQESVPDPMWFEADLQETIVAGIEELLKIGDLEGVIFALNNMQQTLAEVGHNWGVQESLNLLDAVRALVGEYTRSLEITDFSSEGQLQRLGSSIAMADFCQLGFVRIVLGFSERLRSATAEGFADSICGINWKRKGDIYQTLLPRPAIEQLEELSKQLDFEYAVEGQHVTPLWYRQQLIATEFAKYIVDTTNHLIGRLEVLFVDDIECLIKDGHHALAAQACGRGLEALRKSSICVHEARRCLDCLSTFTRELGFLFVNTRWPETDWESVLQRIEQTRRQVLKSFGATVPGLIALPRSMHLPDMLGHAFSVLADGSFQAMSTGDEETFRFVFPACFVAGLAVHDRLREQLRHREEWAQLNLSAEPIMDILELSGYAIVYTELGRGLYWPRVRGVWDRYFSESTDQESRLRYLEAVISFKDSSYSITPRGMQRTGWSQVFEHQLRDMGIVDDSFESRLVGKRSALDEWPPVVRVVARGGPMIDDLYNVFLAVYFQGNPSLELNLPHRAREFADWVERTRSFDEPAEESPG